MIRLPVLIVAMCVAGCCAAVAAEGRKATIDYISEPMPPGFQVVGTEIEGPVFAEASGKTLYMWPRRGLRGGSVGEDQGTPGCYDVRETENVGYFSPWPAGNELPNAANRPTCVQYWPPVLAAEDAKPVGNWSIVLRKDGVRQWAYNEYALYTSHLDRKPGDTNGGWSLRAKAGGDQGAPRRPLTPQPNVPSQFDVSTKNLGRLLTTNKGYSVYSYDKDTPTTSNCVSRCLEDWEPLVAPDAAVAAGDWSTIQRPGGQRQWVFRGKPLYRHLQDSVPGSYAGNEISGWHSVFMQTGPRIPQSLRIVDVNGGQVIANADGKPVYYHDCVEDTFDSLRCDTPDAAQEYRWAMCGGGNPARCLEVFPYLIADKYAKSENNTWGIRDIDPMSGRYVATGTPGSVRIWTFRDRPMYTFYGDREVGDLFGDAWGQDHASKNGFNALWVRDVFFGLD